MYQGRSKNFNFSLLLSDNVYQQNYYFKEHTIKTKQM